MPDTSKHAYRSQACRDSARFVAFVNRMKCMLNARSYFVHPGEAGRVMRDRDLTVMANSGVCRCLNYVKLDQFAYGECDQPLKVGRSAAGERGTAHNSFS